jgi:putative NADH-flavin reductase
MVDTDLLVQALRKRGHTVGAIFHVPENAGEYELDVDGDIITLAEARSLLEQKEATQQAY